MHLTAPISCNLCSVCPEEANEFDEAVFGLSRGNGVAHLSELVVKYLADFAHPKGAIAKHEALTLRLVPLDALQVGLGDLSHIYC